MVANAVTYFVSGLHCAQAAWSAYGLYASWVAITNLQQYEERSKQAAKYSGTAEHQLHKTRTTQTSGALAILASHITALVLAFSASRLPRQVCMLASPALLLITLFARTHVSDFWKARAKVPFMDGYNEAISKTTALMYVLEWLEWSWVGTAIVAVMLGYGH